MNVQPIFFCAGLFTFTQYNRAMNTAAEQKKFFA